MLIAYLDEFGHVGPYISPDHRKFFHNPVFGYGGIVLPSGSVRSFGAKFEHAKERQFRSEIHLSGQHPRRWEKKGAEIFTTGSYHRYPMRVQHIAELSDYLQRLGGRIFYYGEVKTKGSPAESGESAAERTKKALTETVRRLCRFAEHQNKDLLVVLDEGGPMPREDAITSMAQFIYSSRNPEMKRILEVPMQLESHRYGAIQYADWICAALTRACHFHFTESVEFEWAPAALGRIIDGHTVRESRVWVPELHEAVSGQGLSHPKKWIDREPRPRPSHLTQRIGDIVIG